MKIGIKKLVDVDVVRMQFSAKIRDEGSYTFYDADGDMVKEYEGYVPDFVPGEYGDYIDLMIDLETGQILNWDADEVRRQLPGFINGDE